KLSATGSLRMDTKRKRKGTSGARLKSESRLITHRNAIEHVARRDGGPVSLGAFIKTTKRLRPENPCGHRRCQRPFSFSVCRQRQRRRTLDSDFRGLRCL